MIKLAHCPDKNGKCDDAPIKNSIGNDSQKFIRAVKNVSRINFGASEGIGGPCSAFARVHAISRFWHRHTIPHVLKNTIVPSPPPTLMLSVRFPAPGAARNFKTSHEATTTTTRIGMAKTQPLLIALVPACSSPCSAPKQIT